MCPILFRIGPFNIYSYGLMVALAFIAASWVFSLDLKRRRLDPNLASSLTLIALIAGIVGAKVLFLIEHWSEFILDPFGMALSPGGLTWYGGLILAFLVVYVYLKRKKLPVLILLDAVAPALILGYGIGRIGCQLSGDGDYGIPSNLPWAMGYPNGVVSTLSDRNPQLRQLYMDMHPGEPIPIDIKVHPTPVYETLASLLIFFYLWKIRKKPMPAGSLFMTYLVFAGIERFLIEFIRLNPKIFLGLTEAQWMSLIIIMIGVVGFYMLKSSGRRTSFPKGE
ncbi:MAG: prolipoprotein diacylglyceryl transferase [Bacteroidota bacterium]